MGSTERATGTTSRCSRPGTIRTRSFRLLHRADGSGGRSLPGRQRRDLAERGVDSPAVAAFAAPRHLARYGRPLRRSPGSIRGTRPSTSSRTRPSSLNGSGSPPHVGAAHERARGTRGMGAPGGRAGRRRFASALCRRLSSRQRVGPSDSTERRICRIRLHAERLPVDHLLSHGRSAPQRATCRCVAREARLMDSPRTRSRRGAVTGCRAGCT